ncbi:MAG: polysaccharide pyruvyl transferase family protein [Caldilineaceae bacterium]|nr:polysaccharide pyruvyl transferase family protein [Caldilineaceae bacterium]
MKILMVNVHSVRNAGDDALLQAAMQQLRRHFPDCTITLAMNDRAGYYGPEPTVDSFLPWFRRQDKDGPPLRTWRWLAIPGRLLQLWLYALLYRKRGHLPTFALTAEQHNLLQAYAHADMVVSCPGGYLYSTGKLGLWFLVTLLTLAYPIWLGKPVYLLPQTIGPLQYGWERWLLRRLLPQIRQIYVRDDYSRTLLETLGIHHPQLHVTPDLAFGYQADDRAVGVNLLRQLGIDLDNDQPLLGVTLINWAGMERSFQGQEAYEAAVASAIRAFVTAHGGRAVLFAQVRGPALAEDDRVPARRVQQHLSDLDDRIVVVEAEVTTAQLQAAYSYMTLFMGSRLHSNIFALSAGVPVIAIAYLPKTRGVMRTLGLEQWVVDIASVEGSALYALLSQLYTNRAAVRAQVQTAMAAQQAAISAMSHALATDFHQEQGQR